MTDDGEGVSSLTGDGNWFEDFTVGQRIRHARGATVGEVENNYLTKMVMNTAQSHWNEHVMAGSPFGDGRLVFGLITGSIVIGLASQDTSENALAEQGVSNLRFLGPVHQGDTLYAYSEVLAKEDLPGQPGEGVVRFKHWGATQDERIVFEGERTVVVKRRTAWASR
jgi:itaconyl-CoA hydratase